MAKKKAAAKKAAVKTAKKSPKKKSASLPKAASKGTPKKKTTSAKTAAKGKATKAATPGRTSKPLSPSQKLENKLREWLGAKKKISLEWDCGGDETLIFGKINKEKWPWQDEDFLFLCDILIDRLQLPNAGEEFNKGGGSIQLKNDQVVLVYDATYLGVDWDEESGDVVEREPEQLKGELNLFGKGK